jgi:hypothetical protein
MATPGQLVDRVLAESGLRTTGGRGLSAAQVTAADAANLLLAICGAGHSSDAMAIWIAQFVGREIRLLDYIEGVGQPRHDGDPNSGLPHIIVLPGEGVQHSNGTKGAGVQSSPVWHS